MMESGTYARVVKRLAFVVPALLMLVLVACGEPQPPTPAPSISSFEADPTTIELGQVSQLSWSVANANSVTLEVDGETVVADGGLEGSYEFAPERVGEHRFVLTATNGSDSETSELVVNVWAEPEITSIAAEVVSGSRLLVTWVGQGNEFDIEAVAEGGATEVLREGVTESQAEVPIPASTHQTLRVTAHGNDASDFAELDLSDLPIVVRADDYDPFNSLGWVPETPLEGTLRYWIDAAPEGSTIGFAQDIDHIDIRGVEVVPNPLCAPTCPPGVASGFDTHLAIKQDLIISGPADSRVTIEMSSVSDDPDENVAFMYRSRAVLVNLGVEATLENLVITGGTYISNGAGVRNNGTLTVRNSHILGNRAWDKGGGLFNDVGADLTLIDSLVADNQAVTLAEEVGTSSSIRGSDPAEWPEGTFELPDGGYGGGLFNEDGATVTIVNTVFEGNFAKISGGGIFNEPSGAVTMEGGRIVDNVADFSDEVPAVDPPEWYFSYGGGVLNAGTFELTDSQITGNDAFDQGGGLYQGIIGEAHLTGVNISGNSADWGGGVRNHYCEENFFQTEVSFSGNIGRLGGPETNNLYATEGDATECAGGGAGALGGTSLFGPAQDIPMTNPRER